ncbi:hypothetical protein [Staphylococcus shinii]|uniref:hypothetical protein n=1 Tax=Staphylococcus shinii TaxID=2912228 RepID=UPI003518292F
MKIIGYHGTNRDIKERILKTNFTLSNKNNWFGQGLYLFEQDYDMAQQWAKRKYKRSISSVIECEIVVNNDNVIDLTDPSSQNNKEFHELRTKQIYELVESENLKIQDTFGLDKVIIDLLFDSGIELFKCPSYTYTEEDTIYSLSSRIPNGIELVIRNLSLIKQKR